MVPQRKKRVIVAVTQHTRKSVVGWKWSYKSTEITWTNGTGPTARNSAFFFLIDMDDSAEGLFWEEIGLLIFLTEAKVIPAI